MKCYRIFVGILFFLLSLSTYSQTSKLSPLVRQAALSPSVSYAKGSKSAATPTITAFVRTSNTNVLRNEGCRIYAQWDDIVIAAIPLDKINNLASMPQISRIEAGESCFITNDTTATITKARELWSTQIEGRNNEYINGNGVVVGVMDIGFDLTHPTFRSADGTTLRVKALWDMLQFSPDSIQGDVFGSPVIGENDTIYIGRQYVGEDELMKKLHTADGIIMTHGTHTAGTAAGSGFEGKPITSSIPYRPATFSGMAPGADICLVANCAGDNIEIIPKEDRYKYTTATDMLGFKYIFDYAESVGKPCVINFSEGAHDDLYEHGIYEEVLSKMTGPGRILCSSAGNEGTKGSYIHKEKNQEKAGSFISSYSSNALYVMSSEQPVQMSIKLYSKSGEAKEWSFDAEPLRDYPDSIYTDILSLGDDSLNIYVNTYPSCVDETKFATDLLISNHKGKYIDRMNKAISLTVYGKDNDIEIYNAGGFFVANNIDPELADFTCDHNILFPASMDNVICIGNVGYRTGYRNIENKWLTLYDQSIANGKRAIYSSSGPTIDGNIKPDVMAPGMNIISAFNSFCNNNSTYNYYKSENFIYNSREYSWGGLSGTSMSTPVVTGIIALWLQAFPTLTPDQIKEVFANTCSHYDESLTYPNNLYGYGTIDALEGLKYIQNTFTGINNISDDYSIADSHYNIYSISGMPVSKENARHGIYIITNGKQKRKIIL